MLQFRTVLLSPVLAAATALLIPTPSSADALLGTIVPAYFYPGTGGPGGVGDGWAAMAAAASKIPISAIFNPNSGPLPGPADPNYVTAMTNLENAGGQVVAYVYTNYGSTPLATVESQMSTYITQYGSLVDGFYLDAMSTNPSEVAYYQSLASYVQGLSSTDLVIGNPGTATIAAYLGALPITANTFNTFEGSSSSFAGYVPPSSYQNYPSGMFSDTIYDATTIAAMLADIDQAVQQNTGYVYVMDQSLNPPAGYLYDQLPSYWDQEVAAIAAIDTPEPGTAAMLALGGLLTFLSVAAKLHGRGTSAR